MTTITCQPWFPADMGGFNQGTVLRILLTLVCHCQELKPTMDELGIASIDEMGYNKPELALPNPYDIHG